MLPDVSDLVLRSGNEREDVLCLSSHSEGHARPQNFFQGGEERVHPWLLGRRARFDGEVVGFTLLRKFTEFEARFNFQ